MEAATLRERLKTADRVSAALMKENRRLRELAGRAEARLPPAVPVRTVGTNAPVLTGGGTWNRGPQVRRRGGMSAEVVDPGLRSRPLSSLIE